MSLIAGFCEEHTCSDPPLAFQLCVQSAMLFVCEDIGTKMKLEKKATLYPELLSFYTFNFFLYLHLFHFLCFVWVYLLFWLWPTLWPLNPVCPLFSPVPLFQFPVCNYYLFLSTYPLISPFSTFLYSFSFFLSDSLSSMHAVVHTAAIFWVTRHPQNSGVITDW